MIIQLEAMMITSNSTVVLLDRNLSVSQVNVSDEVKKILTSVIRQASSRYTMIIIFELTLDRG